MAGNGISYVGRLINNKGQAEYGVSAAGNPVLKLVLAEQHTGKNSKVQSQFQDRSKGADDYVPTTTSWHRITLFGDDATRLATDPDVNHGALIQVTNANYTEEDAWETRDGVKRAGRPETIGRDSSIAVFERNGNRYGAKPEYAEPIWDGASQPKRIGGGNGGGNGGGREYREDEGF